MLEDLDYLKKLGYKVYSRFDKNSPNTFNLSYKQHRHTRNKITEQLADPPLQFYQTIWIIYSKLKKQNPAKGGENHITDAIQTLIKDKNKFIAHNFSGKYLDCGSMHGYLKWTLEISKLWNYAW